MRATASVASLGVSAGAKATVGAPWAFRKVFSSNRSWATASAREPGATSTPRAASQATDDAGTFSNS